MNHQELTITNFVAESASGLLTVSRTRDAEPGGEQSAHPQTTKPTFSKVGRMSNNHFERSRMDPPCRIIFTTTTNSSQKHRQTNEKAALGRTSAKSCPGTWPDTPHTRPRDPAGGRTTGLPRLYGTGETHPLQRLPAGRAVSSYGAMLRRDEERVLEMFSAVSSCVIRFSTRGRCVKGAFELTTVLPFF